MEFEDLVNIFENSLEEFFRLETNHVLSGVSERNLCGRFALYLNRNISHSGFSEYFVDTEYNRKQNGEIKTILDGQLNVIRICCDLILHSRGVKVKLDNLICLEMKKANRPLKEKENDRNRLRVMTKSSYNDVWSSDGITHPEHVCGYVLGIYVEVDSDNRQVLIEYYRESEMERTFSVELTRYIKPRK